MQSATLTQLEQLVLPTLEPVEISDVMTYVHPSASDEALIRMLLPMCRNTLEGKLGIAFLTQQLRATFEFGIVGMGLVGIRWNYDNMLCTLPRPPLQSFDIVAVESDIDVFTPVTTATYDTIRQFPAQVYLFGDAFGMVEYPWWINLNREPRVQVTYTCGYQSPDVVPDKYKALLYQFIADSYLQREGGGMSAELGAAILAEKVIDL